MSTQKDNRPYPLKDSFSVFLNFIIACIALFCIGSFWPWAIKIFSMYDISNTNQSGSYEYKTMQATWALTSYVAFIGILITITFFFFVFKYINKNKKF